MTKFHPESPEISPAALSRLYFLADLRGYLHGPLSKTKRGVFSSKFARTGDLAPGGINTDQRRAEIRSEMETSGFFQAWSSALRSSQDLMWQYIGEVVGENEADLDQRLAAVSQNPRGSLRLNPDVKIPAYLSDADTHRMPGSYFREAKSSDLFGGALYDLGGVIYQFGVGHQGGKLLNDRRGRTMVSFLKHRYPTLDPQRILDMGCTVGQNTLPLCDGFPNAQIYGLDIGAPVLRYAHLRAEGLEKAVHFVQGNAESTPFENDYFDVVVSQIMFHEMSPDALPAVMRESWRILKPGGIMAHLEVPLRYDQMSVADQFFSSWEHYYNAESNIEGFGKADLVGDAVRAGFVDVFEGFQPSPPPGRLDPLPLGQKQDGSVLYIVSGRKPL